MARIAVTGGSGKLGSACVLDLVAQGHDVVVLDMVPPRVPGVIFVQTDFEDFGETIQALSQIDGRYDKVDAVVHLAAIPGPTRAPGATIFRLNTLSTYNVFEACRRLGIERVVWASSETLMVVPMDRPPRAIPLDESHGDQPESAYALSKHLGEMMAAQFCRWNPQATMIGLRFSNVMAEEDYADFPGFQDDPLLRKWNLWSYIDARDGAQAIRRALEVDIKGDHNFIIANDDTVMHRPNRELMAAVFPGVDVPEAYAGTRSMLSSEKAKAVLGYAPVHGWR